MKKCFDESYKSAINVFCFLVFVFSIFATVCCAENPEFASSPNPVGSGARALGMGGAFIAVADDATAASWNPAGLIQLDFPEISAVWAAFHRSEDNSSGEHPDMNGKEHISESSPNYFSFAYPFNLFGRNMIASLNHQHMYDFNRKWDFSYQQSDEDKTVNYQQDGSLTALGIAYSTQITHELSFGLTLNFWDNDIGKNEWNESSSVTASGKSPGGYKFTQVTKKSDHYVFEGFNVNVGLMYQTLDQKITVGAVLKTPFKADLEHGTASYNSTEYPDLPEYSSETQNPWTHTEETLEMPMSYGIGLAYRFSDVLTMAADVYRTEWDDFILDNGEEEKSAVTGRLMSESDVSPTHQVRLGIEYLYVGDRHIFPIRGGVFYDPAPAEGSPDDFWGFSMGSGVLWDRLFNDKGCIKAVILDFAYQYRFGNDVGKHMIKNWGFSQDVEEHTFYSSVIVHF